MNTEKLNNTDEFEVGFMDYLSRCGYLSDDLFNPSNGWKLKRYRDEYTKNYSYEKSTRKIFKHMNNLICDCISCDGIKVDSIYKKFEKSKYIKKLTL